MIVSDGTDCGRPENPMTVSTSRQLPVKPLFTGGVGFAAHEGSLVALLEKGECQQQEDSQE
jgi:hypothetical protein